MTGSGGRWAFHVSLIRVQRLAGLRCRPGVEVAECGDDVWVSGSGLDAALSAVLAVCADGPVYHVDAQNRLIPYGHQVPVGRLPVLQWQPLTRWLEPELPVTQIVRARFSACRLTLERSAMEQPAAVLVTSWSDFESWAEEAAEVRLRACQFAVCVDDQRRLVCLRGRPLPPLPGPRYWGVSNLAVPCGFTWSPAVDAETVRAVLERRAAETAASVTSAELILWHASGEVDVIQRGEFLPSLRTHVRATSRILSDPRSAGVVHEAGGGRR
ncbi:MAG: hypothetical protein ACKO2P_09575 [Planctomycetota bacterium]